MGKILNFLIRFQKANDGLGTFRMTKKKSNWQFGCNLNFLFRGKKRMNFVFRRKKTNDYLSTTANFAFGCKKSKKKKKKKEVKNKKKRMGVWVQKLNTMKIL